VSFFLLMGQLSEQLSFLKKKKKETITDAIEAHHNN